MTIQGVIAANRFGLGARPGDVARISGDPKAWLLAQLTPERELPAPLRSLPSAGNEILRLRRQWRERAEEAARWSAQHLDALLVAAHFVAGDGISK